MHHSVEEVAAGRVSAQRHHRTLASVSYPVVATVAKLRALGLPPPVESELVGILETGNA
jgi:hypothetical protein